MTSSAPSASWPNPTWQSDFTATVSAISGWFEAYLSGQWYTFDARHNRPRIGRILMATGRDAADVALTTSFGRMILSKFFVVSDEVVAA